MSREMEEYPVGTRTQFYVCPPDWEFGWVTDLEYFDDLDDPIEVTRQTWQLVRTARVRIHPRLELCTRCHGEGEIEVATSEPDQFGNVDHDMAQCPRCEGSGTDPLAGQVEVIE